MHDLLAVRIIEEARKMGLRVPDDIAVTGFDNLLIADQISPGLTSASQAYYELGKKAAGVLIDSLTRAVEPGCKYYVPCPIIIRESSGGGQVVTQGRREHVS